MKIALKTPGLDKITNREDIKCPNCGLVYKFIEHSERKIYHYSSEGEPNEQISLRMVLGREKNQPAHIDCLCNKCHAEFIVQGEDDGEA